MFFVSCSNLFSFITMKIVFTSIYLVWSSKVCKTKSSAGHCANCRINFTCCFCPLSLGKKMKRKAKSVKSRKQRRGKKAMDLLAFNTQIHFHFPISKVKSLISFSLLPPFLVPELVYIWAELGKWWCLTSFKLNFAVF